MGRKRNNQFGLSRRSGFRPTRPIVVVVCDDAKTAVRYFNILKTEVKDKVTVIIVPAPCDGATPDILLDTAKAELQSLSKTAGDRQSVWIIIDREGQADKQRPADQAKKTAPNNIRVALSMPCFEIWTLAHLIDTGELFKDCPAVVSRIKKEWKKKFRSDFNKTQADYSKLMPFRDDAITRTCKRQPHSNQSWTEVYRVVQEILDFSQNQP